MQNVTNIVTGHKGKKKQYVAVTDRNDSGHTVSYASIVLKL
jgi:hypothetical protein